MDRDLLIQNLGITEKTPKEINAVLAVFEEETGRRVQNMLEEILSEEDVSTLSRYDDVIEYQKYLAHLIPDAKERIEKIQTEIIQNYRKNT